MIARLQVLALCLLALVVVGCDGQERTAATTPRPAPAAASPTVPAAGLATPGPTVLPQEERSTPAPATPARTPIEQASATPRAVEVEVLVAATGLDTPWALAFAPDGRLFLTERAGRLRVIEDGRLREQPIATLPVRETAEGGLMGLALDPDFPDPSYLYVMYTHNTAQGLRNRVARLRLDGGVVGEEETLLDDLPAANIHDGGRVRFGPDGMLYATVGDAAASDRAQDRTSLAGKILRLNRDGTVPADNPFPGSYVYSLGHRNPEGLAWQPGSGRLYATEHGASGNDEVNLIEAGQNYGWPRAEGAQHAAPYRAPVAVFSPAIAPAGATFYSGTAIPQWRDSFFFATLRGSHLRRLVFDQDDPHRALVDERLYQGVYGRLRDVVEGPDGALYVATSNRDGRGVPRPDDDRILRIGPR